MHRLIGAILLFTFGCIWVSGCQQIEKPDGGKYGHIAVQSKIDRKCLTPEMLIRLCNRYNLESRNYPTTKTERQNVLDALGKKLEYAIRICSYCENVYGIITQKTTDPDARWLTHGICSPCSMKLYAEGGLEWTDKNKKIAIDEQFRQDEEDRLWKEYFKKSG